MHSDGRHGSDEALWPPDLLDAGGVCHALSISDRQFRRLLASGRLPQSDVQLTSGPKGRRWSRDKLLRWLDAHPTAAGMRHKDYLHDGAVSG